MSDQTSPPFLIHFRPLLRVSCGAGTLLARIHSYGAFMLRKVSSTAVWVAIFIVIVAVQAYSALLL